MIDPTFKKQVHLLLDVLEDVFLDDKIAMKGGTAINFFVENMPRLSVDIDLVYLPLTSREVALKDISDILNGMQKRLSQKRGIHSTIKRTSTDIPRQIRVVHFDVAIKIEINLVVRGSLFGVTPMRICEKVEKEFQKSSRVPILNIEELYAGKFCAALDRQHPRDLFDVMIFLQKNRFTEKLKNAFLVYLMSGNRPISELIRPTKLDQRVAFEREFVGMTDQVVSYAQLDETRDILIDLIDKNLNDRDRQFLLSLKTSEPQWDLLSIQGVDRLPAIKWKLQNIKTMSTSSRQKSYEELKRKLQL